MSTSEALRLKLEIEKQEKTLNELLKKWDADPSLRRLPKQDQLIAVRAIMSAKRLALVLIPKLKFKVDLCLKKPNDQIFQQKANDEWTAMQPKIASTLRQFDILETGKKPEYPSKEQKDRDRQMSKNIEESLKSKRSEKVGSTRDDVTSTTSQFSEDGSGDMFGKSGCASKRGNRRTGDALDSLSASSGDYVENVRNFKERLSKRQTPEGKLSEIVEDVCPEDAASVKEYIRSLTTSETPNVLTREMLDEIRGFDVGEIDQRKKRDKRLQKSKDIREQRIQKIEKMTEVEPILKRSTLPSPLPIDGFLDLVETLPGEIQRLVSKETQALTDHYKCQMFSKAPPLFARRGKLINMNNLKNGLKDDRFDASDFHLRTEDSAIAQEHLKMLKANGVDNAVGRIFGTFSSDLDVEDSNFLVCPEDDVEQSFNDE